MNKLITITKNEFLNYINCSETALYRIPKNNNKKRYPDLTSFLQKVKKHPYFKNNITIKKDKRYIRKKETLDKIREKCKFIFNATFIKTKIPIRLRTYIDILETNSDGTFNIYLIKPSNQIKEQYINELLYNLNVLNFFGLSVKKIFLVYLNSTYKKNKRISPKFLKISDVTNDVLLIKEKGNESIINIANIKLHNNSKKTKINRYNSKCNNCPVKSKCWKNIPHNSVLYLNRISKLKLQYFKDNNIKIIEEIPKSYINKLSTTQKRQCLSYLEKDSYINIKEISDYIFNINKPIFIDIENKIQIVPRKKGDKPNSIIFTKVILLENNIIRVFNPLNNYDLIKLFYILENNSNIITFNSNLLKIFLNKKKETFNLDIEQKIISLDNIFKSYSFYNYNFKNNPTLQNISIFFNCSDHSENVTKYSQIFKSLKNIISTKEKEIA